MIQRGIEYTDVENAIYHNEGNCIYLKTVTRAKQSEIKLYKKYKR